MKSFKHSCPTEVIFGFNKLSFISESIPKSLQRVLVLSSKSAAEKSGALSIVLERLGEEGRHVEYLNNISPNPRLEEINLAVELCKEQRIQAIVGIGGGSALDAAKAVALCAGGEVSADELLKVDIKNIVPLYLVAVPTTAGTGSEVSKGAIVSDVKNNWKGGIRGDNVFPKVAILDPTLTESLPKAVSIETGFDVVTHAFESLVSKASTPITEMYSMSALEIVIPALVKLGNGDSSAQVREDLMFASLLAGYNLANASTCLPHRLQYPLGANTDSAHARGLASLYPSWFKHTYEYAQVDFDFLTNILMDTLTLKSTGDSKADCLTALDKFLELLEMNHGMRKFGVAETDCAKFASQVDGNLSLDPGKTDLSTLEEIYRESL
ncbi:iron-containing alcohol dehydrogenase [Vibrio breoganii]